MRLTTGVPFVPCRIDALARLALWRTRSPTIDEARVVAFGLLNQRQFLVAQRLDVIGVGGSALIAFLLRKSRLELQSAHLVGDERRPRPQVVLFFRQHMPAQNRKLARARHRSDLMPPPCPDAHEEGMQRSGRHSRGPSRLDDQARAWLRPTLLMRP